MSELKSFIVLYDGKFIRAYDATEANKVIADLNKEIARLDDLAHAHNIELLRKENLIAEVKAKLESVQATAYAESVDAGMENRKLRRALWLARAERAAAWQIHFSLCHNHSIDREFYINGASMPCEGMVTMRTARDWAMIWENVERKCRAKAEEYK